MKSHSIIELYQFTPDVDSGSSGRLNPLTAKGSLNAAEFIDMRISTQRSRVGIIFDIRGLSFEGSNTALLVLTDVEKARWVNDSKQRRWSVRQGNWDPTASMRIKPVSMREVTAEVADQGGWALDAPPAPTTAATDTTERSSKEQVMPKSEDIRLPAPESEATLIPQYTLNRSGIWDRLTASAGSAKMYIGRVEGMDSPLPVVEQESDAAIIAKFPQWSSMMTVHGHYSYPAVEPGF